EMGTKMEQLRFNVIVNPFGTLFNPHSIAKAIERIGSMKSFVKEDLFFYDGYWRSFNHSTLFGEREQELFLKRNNDILERTSHHFKESKFIFLTLGTSWVFRNIESGEVVANCHKLPQSKFNREFLSYRESFELLAPLLTPDKEWIVTVSPVRHLKDGAHGNQLSKANLLMAVDLLTKEGSHIHYFPAYEIFMDQLRDYRFYAADMVHPSHSATDYIWSRFCADILSPGSGEKMALISKLNSLKGHSLHSGKEGSLVLERKIEELERKIDAIIEE
ncbi:MAG: GSCFA domain-containing protein, partial [Bacteroidales bacterium]